MQYILLTVGIADGIVAFFSPSPGRLDEIQAWFSGACLAAGIWTIAIKQMMRRAD